VNKPPYKCCATTNCCKAIPYTKESEYCNECIGQQAVNILLDINTRRPTATELHKAFSDKMDALAYTALVKGLNEKS